MKPADKKELAPAHTGKPEHNTQGKKQTSGDKDFDNAIDKMLKKPVYIAPAK